MHEKEFSNLIEAMTKLSKKKKQSSFVIFGIIKYSIKILLPNIESDAQIVESYLDVLKQMIKLLNLKDGEKFKLFKENLLKSIESKNFDDIQHLILNHEISEDEHLSVSSGSKNL